MSAEIYYYDIGDYLSRAQKLSKIREFGTVTNIPWEKITPNEKHDWIHQRDGAFDSLIMLGNNKDGGAENRFFYPVHTNGLKTQRDAWCYNFSSAKLAGNMRATIGFYNAERARYAEAGSGKPDPIDFVDSDATKISWTEGLRNDLKKNVVAAFDKTAVREALYRPFQKQFLYCDKQFNERVGIQQKAFPTSGHKNLVICVSGVGVTKEFSCIITDTLPDLELIGKSQCFPLWWYEEKKSSPDLFDADTPEGAYVRRDGVTDWILSHVRSRYGAGSAVTKEMIFYYVYGLLHSPNYRERFSADLKKSLPRIPVVDSFDDFLAFSDAGKRLAALHLDYENVPAYGGVTVEAIKPVTYKIPAQVPEIPEGALVAAEPCAHAEKTFDDYGYYAVEKMTFAKTRNEGGKLVADKSTVHYNHFITIKNIPATAYEYVVNGKSAIEWLMERYAVTTDKDSQIKNDPNDWAREHEKPRYILDLLLSVINVSVQTAEIVKGLPQVELG